MNPKEPWEWWLIGALTLALLGAVAILLQGFLRPAWEIAGEVRIARPQEAVIDLLLDPERRSAWQPGVMDGAMLTGEPGEIGSTWLLILRRGRERGEAEERLVALASPERLDLQREAPETLHRIEIRLAADTAGTRLVWHERLSWTTWQGRLLAIFHVGEEEERLRIGLARLARILEDG